MNTFWLKMAGFAVVVVVLIVLVNVFTGPMPTEQVQDDEQTVQQEQAEESASESQRESLEDRSSRRALERQQKSVPNRIDAMRQRGVVEQPSEPVRQKVQDLEIEDEVQAERLYQMAVTSSKIARKPMMTYKKMVDYCRQIIQSYPNSIQAEKSRQLLREMPRRDRKMYKVTNEEMGIGK